MQRRQFAAALAALGLAGAGRRAAAQAAPQRIRYGGHASQFGDLRLPAGPGRVPVIVVVHGGFWLQGYDLSLGAPLAADLAAHHGVAAWNIEYRRVGGGGGWPGTFDDAAAALDALAGPVQAAAGGRIDLTRVVAVGHSAGGHLAVWLASRHRLPAGAPGANPKLRLAGAVSQAGVLDLADGAERGLGFGAVSRLLGGGPGTVPERYAAASPVALLPIGVPVVCVHGEADGIVPIRQSERYVAAARAAGDPAELQRLPGTGHFEVIDARDPAWSACRAAALRLAGR